MASEAVTKLVMKMLQRGQGGRDPAFLYPLHGLYRPDDSGGGHRLRHLGVNMTSIITVIGAAGAAIALALQDSLKNIASGILILVSHPFRWGIMSRPRAWAERLRKSACFTPP